MVLVWISRVLTSWDLSTYRKRLIDPEKNPNLVLKDAGAVPQGPKLQ
jgi:hypothetical protein